MIVRMKSVTVHRLGPNHTARVECISGMHVPVGNPDTVAYPPGVAFESPEAEGRALLKVQAGEIVEEAPA